MKLTTAQQRVLDAINRTVDQHGVPPTVRELTRLLGFTSPNGVHGHLRALKRKGVIHWLPNAARSITVIERRRKCPHCGEVIE